MRITNITYCKNTKKRKVLWIIEHTEHHSLLLGKKKKQKLVNSFLNSPKVRKRKPQSKIDKINKYKGSDK